MQEEHEESEKGMMTKSAEIDIIRSLLKEIDFFYDEHLQAYIPQMF